MAREIGDGVLFTPHLAPLDRGLLATCYARATDGADTAAGPRRAARRLRRRAVRRGHRHAAEAEVGPGHERRARVGVRRPAHGVRWSPSGPSSTSGRARLDRRSSRANVVLGLDQLSGLSTAGVWPERRRAPRVRRRRRVARIKPSGAPDCAVVACTAELPAAAAACSPRTSRLPARCRSAGRPGGERGPREGDRAHLGQRERRDGFGGPVARRRAVRHGRHRARRRGARGARGADGPDRGAVRLRAVPRRPDGDVRRSAARWSTARTPRRRSSTTT